MGGMDYAVQVEIKLLLACDGAMRDHHSDLRYGFSITS